MIEVLEILIAGVSIGIILFGILRVFSMSKEDLTIGLFSLVIGILLLCIIIPSVNTECEIKLIENVCSEKNYSASDYSITNYGQISCLDENRNKVKLYLKASETNSCERNPSYLRRWVNRE